MELNLALAERTTGELFELYKENKDKLVKQEIVLRYCDMVRTIAVQLRGVYMSFAELDDVVNEGIIALMQSLIAKSKTAGLFFANSDANVPFGKSSIFSKFLSSTSSPFEVVR